MRLPSEQLTQQTMPKIVDGPKLHAVQVEVRAKTLTLIIRLFDVCQRPSILLMSFLTLRPIISQMIERRLLRSISGVLS